MSAVVIIIHTAYYNVLVILQSLSLKFLYVFTANVLSTITCKLTFFIRLFD